MAFVPKPREKPIILDKPPWHPDGDCRCPGPKVKGERDRRSSGRWYGGSEACRVCGHLRGRRKWAR